jgi:glycerol uptake facilitator-like aquaporin
MQPLPRRLSPRCLAAEALGSLLLLATVVGSGIMAERLSGGNVAIALIGNTFPTGAILFVLITVLGPVSGAHFNPAVSLTLALRGDLDWRDLALYVAAQIAGAIAGVLLAHAMFDLPLWQVSMKTRTGFAQDLSEFVAAFGLVLTILGCLARAPSAVAAAVGLYIGAAYWFTASTSFANPAVTVARALTDTFSGIAPNGVAGFICAQLLGAIAAQLVARWLWPAAAKKDFAPFTTDLVVRSDP